MKVRVSNLLAFTLLCLHCSFASALTTLYDRGGGMIYDSDNDVTWLQAADGNGNVSWSSANSWVENLNYGGFDDWRMPHHSGATFEEKGLVYEEDELFSLWWRLLATGNPSTRTADGITFTGVDDAYWTDFSALDFGGNLRYGVIYFAGTGPGDYLTNSGENEMMLPSFPARVWAVRDGDVSAVPVPAAAWLFTGALASLGAFGRRVKSS